jgi:WD40 repeat protein
MARQISGTFTITIKNQNENYTIEAKGPKGITVDPQPAPQLKTLLDNLEIIDTLNVLSSSKSLTSTAQIQKLGRTLYDCLFNSRHILLAFGKAQGSASADNGVRMRLQVEPTELAVFPWETLHDGNAWLSAQSITPLVRKLDFPENKKPLRKLQIRGALRILFVGASPEGLNNLKIEETANKLELLLEGQAKKKQIVFDKLLNATLDDLRQALLKDYHILYFAGHGGSEGIFLDDGQGNAREKDGKMIGRKRGDKSLVSAEILAQALKGKQTRLVFLAACETSKASGGSCLLRGFAQDLAERTNLPAIVAMQYFISDMQANSLTTQFFAALAAGRPVDVAMAEARSVLMKKGQVNRDVFSPVLYLQAEDGVLFPKAKNWPVIGLGVALLIAAIVGGLLYRSAEIRQAAVLGQKSLSLFDQGKELDAFVEAIRAGEILQKQNATNLDVINTLQTTLYEGRESNRLEGHDSQVNGLDISADSKTLVSTAGYTIKIWNLETGKEIRTLEENNWINSVSISADGKTLAAVSMRSSGPTKTTKTIKLWNLETGKEIRTLVKNGYDNFDSTGTSSSSNGKILASLTEKNTVKLWNLNTGKEIRSFNSSGGDTVSISVDGKILAVAGAQEIKIWNLKTGKKIRTLRLDFGPVLSTSISSDGKILATGRGDHAINLWNLETGKKIYILKGHSDVVWSVSMSLDGKTLASGSRDNTIKLWNLKTGKEIFTWRGHDDGVKRVRISADGKTLASGGGDNRIKLWNLEKSKTIRTLRGDAYPVDTVSINANGKILASAIGERIEIWNIETGKKILALKGNTRIGTVSISADGKTLASGEWNMIKVWNLNTGKAIHTLKGANLGLTVVNISANGKTIASLSRDNEITVWNVDTGKKLRTIKGNAKFVGYHGAMSISADGKILASSAGTINYRTIEVWNLETGEKIHTLRPGQNVSSMSLSSDGKTLATSGGVFEGSANTINVWNLKTGKEIHTLRGHDDQILSISMSADGKILASGSNDKTIRVWNIETGQTIATLKGFDDGPIVSMSADGKTLASGSGMGTIKVWDLDLDSLVRHNCNWVRNYLLNNRNVSENDRHLCDGISIRR